MKNLYKTILHLILLCSTINMYGTHMAGADLTYQSLGNGQYLVTYTFYRDCIGIPAQTSIPLTVNSAVCNIQMSATLFPVPGTGQLISYTCPGALTTCNGGSAPGIQKWEYTAIVSLPSQCPDWTFGVQECCRNAAITTVVNASSYNMYLEAHLNNTIADDNSPVFSNVPIAFECIGQDNYFNHGGLDADGDSLVYSFYTPYDSPNVPVQYDIANGYSLTHPISSTPPISINSLTGDIFMHPTAPEITIIAVRIEEYRNGVLIGSVIRDIQIYTIVCNNLLPVASGINGTTDFNYSACIGDTICFDIFTSDLDLGDSLTTFWNHGIPAATFTIDSNLQHPIIHFCWLPTMADLRPQPYYFVVTVRDDACPTNGVQSFAYSITLQSLQATVASTDVTCFGGHNGTATITPSGSGPFSYVWMPGPFTSPSINHLFAGNYTVDVSNQGGCFGTYYVHVNEPPPININVTGQNASCSGVSGSASVIASGGTGSLDYLWSTTPPQITTTITGLNAGTYTVTVTDDNNCHTSGSVTLTGSSPFTASIVSTPATCLANDGTATVSVSGGSGNFSYLWQPNVSISSSATNLPPGVYTVIVTDNTTGCIQNVSTIINSSTGITATITSSTDATCQSSEDGSATVIGTGGTLPYTYLWSPGGQTTATATNLAPGNYTVMVADYDGCPAFATVTIGYNYASPLLELGIDTTMCIGDILVLDAGAGYNYLWSDNSTNQSLTVTSAGIYSVMITDTNGCESFDAINVNYITCFGRTNLRVTDLSTINVFPNPVYHKVELTINHLQKSTIILNLRNTFGSVLWSSDSLADGYFKKEIDLSKLPAGVYYLEICTDFEKKSVRIVKM